MLVSSSHTLPIAKPHSACLKDRDSSKPPQCDFVPGGSVGGKINEVALVDAAQRPGSQNVPPVAVELQTEVRIRGDDREIRPAHGPNDLPLD